MANADIPINVMAHELELSVTNNFVLENLVLENATVATQDLTGDIIKISAVINRNCARYILTSNSIKVNCVDANQVSVYETNPNTIYCIKFSELVYDDVSKTGTGRLIIEDVTVKDDGTIVVDDYENIIATFETDENRKYKVDSEKAYPYNYDTRKLQDIVEGKQDKLTIDAALSSTSTNPIQNKAVFDALKTKQTKENWELIRTFEVGNEGTYKDTDVMVYNDDGTLKSVIICTDDNGNPFHLKKTWGNVTYPTLSDVESNYSPICNPYSTVALDSNGFPKNSNGLKINNSWILVSPKTACNQKIYSEFAEDGFYCGFSTDKITANDGSNNLRMWAGGTTLRSMADGWGQIMKKVLINAYNFYTASIPLKNGMKVTILGVRKNED